MEQHNYLCLPTDETLAAGGRSGKEVTRFHQNAGESENTVAVRLHRKEALCLGWPEKE
jgi:hypothetical protein